MRYRIAALLLLALLGSLFLIKPFPSATVSDDMVTIETKPVLLAPHTHEAGDSVTDTAHHVDTLSRTFVTPHDMWISSMSAQVRNAPRTVVHHATVLMNGATGRGCASAGGEHLVTFSQDQMHTPYSVPPEEYAIFIPKGTDLTLSAMFHNPLPPKGPGGYYNNVSLSVRLHTVQPKKKLKNLTFHRLCLSDEPSSLNGAIFTIPPGTRNYVFSAAPGNAYSRMRVTKPMRIVYWGAHLHGWQGGKKLLIKKNGTAIATFTTQKAPDDKYRYNTPHIPADIALKPGDEVSIEAVYDNPSDEPIRGAMAIAGLTIAEE